MAMPYLCALDEHLYAALKFAARVPSNEVKSQWLFWPSRSRGRGLFFARRAWKAVPTSMNLILIKSGTLIPGTSACYRRSHTLEQKAGSKAHTQFF
jgi:hypothetical protein